MFKNRSGNVSWRVTGTTNGVRIRKNFASHAEALNEKQQYNNVLSLESQHRTAITTLTDGQIAEAQDAFERLGDAHSLRFAVDFFLGNYRAPNCDYTVKDVLEDFYADKRAAGVRERSITQLRSTLTRFADYVEGKKLHEVTLEHLHAYMRKHDWSRKTQNNVRADIHSFFEWARANPRNWISTNPAHDLPKFKIERIAPEISKTGEYRTIDIQPNLKAWLQPYAKKKAAIHHLNFEKGYKALRKSFNLGHDVLRHSFISYHCAKFQSVGATSLQAGNSESIVRKHYLKMVSKKEAAAFWKIKPK